jgi:hypothetical protein
MGGNDQSSGGGMGNDSYGSGNNGGGAMDQSSGGGMGGGMGSNQSSGGSGGGMEQQFEQKGMQAAEGFAKSKGL